MPTTINPSNILLSIIIPSYNEEHTIAFILDKIDQAVICRRDHRISESNAGCSHLPDTVRLQRDDSIGIQRETSNSR